MAVGQWFRISWVFWMGASPFGDSFKMHLENSNTMERKSCSLFLVWLLRGKPFWLISVSKSFHGDLHSSKLQADLGDPVGSLPHYCKKGGYHNNVSHQLFAGGWARLPFVKTQHLWSVAERGTINKGMTICAHPSASWFLGFQQDLLIIDVKKCKL